MVLLISRFPNVQKCLDIICRNSWKDLQTISSCSLLVFKIIYIISIGFASALCSALLISKKLASSVIVSTTGS